MPRGRSALVAILLAFAVACLLAGSSAADEPTNAPPEPREVHLAVFVVDVDEIDSAAQSFTANVAYLVQWQDPKLAHPGPDPITRSLDQVWNPPGPHRQPTTAPEELTGGGEYHACR